MVKLPKGLLPEPPPTPQPSRRLQQMRMRTAPNPRAHIAILVLLLAALFGIAKFSDRFPNWFVTDHFSKATEAIKRAGYHFANIKNDDDAFRAVGVLLHLQTHYKMEPGEGNAEKFRLKLEAQREESVARIVEALEKYSGQKVGTNTMLWREWARSKGADIDPLDGVIRQYSPGQ